MLPRRFVMFAFSAVLLTAAVLPAADIVNRKSGEKRVAGTITGATKTAVTVKPSTGEPVSVPGNDVASIDWDDAPPDMKIGKTDEQNGRFDAALQRFTKALEDSRTSNELMKTDIEFLMARATARAAVIDPARQEAAVKMLNSFLKAHGDNFRYYDALQLLGQVQLAKKDFADARASFESMSQAPWSDYQLAAKVNLGRVLMGENKLDEAAQAFDGAIATPGTSPADLSRKYEAMVGKARSLIAQNKQADALASLNDVVDKASPEDTALMAEAYVLQGNCLQAVNKTKEAVLAYLHVDVLFARESAPHAEALFNLAKLWKAVQHPDRSLEAQAKLEGSYPNSEWTKKLAAAPAE